MSLRSSVGRYEYGKVRSAPMTLVGHFIVPKSIEDGIDASVIYHLCFIFTRAAKHMAFPINGLPKCRSRKEIVDTGNQTLEGWQEAKKL